MGLTRRHCKWPVGRVEPLTTLFCGEAVVEGKSFCACHCKRAFLANADARGAAGQSETREG